MLKEFVVGIKESNLDSVGLIAIKYNFNKGLTKLKYITYKKIEIILSTTQKDEIVFLWDDGKVMNVSLYIEDFIGKDLTSKKSIERVYFLIGEFLKSLWVKYNWDITDINNLLAEIKDKDFHTSIIYGKRNMSPDKRYSLDLFCDFFPSYTNYYLIIENEKESKINKIKFFEGHPEPAIFFGFFNNFKWIGDNTFLISDVNNEIFFKFDIINNKLEIEYNPRYNTLEQCENYLNAFRAGVSTEIMQSILKF